MVRGLVIYVLPADFPEYVSGYILYHSDYGTVGGVGEFLCGDLTLIEV